MYRSLTDYGVIGNTVSAALVTSDGSIDWCCLPRFDSPAFFLRILDENSGGFCSVKIKGLTSTAHRYVDDTNVLRTTMKSATGTFEVIDFMPVFPRKHSTSHGQDVDAQPRIIRLFRCVEGSIECEIEIRPTMGNAIGSTKHAIDQTGRFATFTDGNQVLQLQMSIKGEVRGDGLYATTSLAAGDRGYVILSCTDAHEKELEAISVIEAHKSLQETLDYWTKWANSCTFDGDFRQQVLRSALLVKMLVYEPTGAIVAAPTNSLPEWPGGPRNWDYRYSWLRDSSLTIAALMKVGYIGEAHDFLQFLHRVLPDSVDKYQIMYGVNGGTDLHEEELHHLDGYRHSRPVRRGNGAEHQTQMDVFGEVAHCNYAYWTHPELMREKSAFEAQSWPGLQKIADYVASNWDQKGSGMWERRGPEQHYTASVGMCWVAVDRVIKLAAQFGLQAEHQAHWEAARHQIRSQIFSQGFHPSVDAFVQAYDSDEADASVLRLPLFDVIDANDDKMRSTVRFIEERLVSNGLVYRYRDGKDGLQGAEGTFTACTLWLAENYAMQGRISEAEELIRRVLSCAGPLGILSEEINPENNELLGNIPQGFSHIALINAASRIAEVKRQSPSRRVA
jgi:GH15 family glucan-1,4-alpha-glucosidase